MLSKPASYRIRVQGQLGPEWSAWFDGLTINWAEPDETTFSGLILDQAVLHGILNKIRDLGLPLLEVTLLPPPSETTA
jgi:hypothetical protein